MKTLGDLLKEITFDSVWVEMLSLYPTEMKNKVGYENAFIELASAPPCEYELPDAFIDISFCVEDPKENSYYHANISNPHCEKTPDGLEPWGGDKGEEPPKGYYNVNDMKYCPSMALFSTEWGEFHRLPVVYRDIRPSAALAIILFEITWHGFSQTKCKSFLEHLESLDTEDTTEFDLEFEFNHEEES